MAYSKGYDKSMFLIGTHEVMHDKYQLVFKHPMGCPRRGAGKDQGKTFHPLALFLEKASECDVAFTPEQQAQIVEMGKALAVVTR